MITATCIYCDEDDPAKFSGREHVIPQAFGTFGGQTPTLKCVCDPCNGALGRELDQMLARETGGDVVYDWTKDAPPYTASTTSS